MLDCRNQPHKDIVDQVDFVIGILIRADKEQVGEMAQHGRAPLVGAHREAQLQLVDKGLLARLGLAAEDDQPHPGRIQPEADIAERVQQQFAAVRLAGVPASVTRP